MTTRVGFIGCGMMGGALARAFTATGRLSGEKLRLCDARQEIVAELARVTGGQIIATAEGLVAASDVVVLAVKPQQLDDLLVSLGAEALGGLRIVVSIAAGYPLGRLRAHTGPGPSVVRTMPNRPVLAGAGVTALMGDEGSTAEATAWVEGLFAAVGETLVLQDEGRFDPVTALSGSGPAFVFRMLEGLIAGAVSVGLEPEIARSLAVSTALGAARLLQATAASPAAERQAVSSPGGTTLAGLAVLDEAGFCEAAAAAVAAAAARSNELYRGPL